MDMTGEQRIGASRERVWQALNDPEILKQCIPGCEELQKLSDTQYEAKVVAKVGPVKAKFSGKVTLSDLDPPNGYTITGEGSGGAAGFGKGGAKVSLAEDGPGATVLSYAAHATVGGKLAQIGSRLVDATARKMADDFFARFTAVVGDGSAEAGTAAGATAGTAAGADGGTSPVLVVDAVPDAGTSPQAPRTAGTAMAEGPAPEPEAVTRAGTSSGQAAEAAASAASLHAVPAGSAGVAAPAKPAGRGVPPAIWIAGIVALVVVLLLIFT
jgi:uncharacterized protein